MREEWKSESGATRLFANLYVLTKTTYSLKLAEVFQEGKSCTRCVYLLKRGSLCVSVCVCVFKRAHTDGSVTPTL